jgi:hypothetical protein
VGKKRRGRSSVTLDERDKEIHSENSMTPICKKSRTEALQILGEKSFNTRGTCLVSGYAAIDLAHQEPTQGGLIDH